MRGPTIHANSRPGSAATTSERVSHVRSGSTLRPVKCAPTRGPSPSSHQHAAQIGLYSPVRVTSAIISYTSPGGRATTIDSEWVRGVMDEVCQEDRAMSPSIATARTVERAELDEFLRPRHR